MPCSTQHALQPILFVLTGATYAVVMTTDRPGSAIHWVMLLMSTFDFDNTFKAQESGPDVAAGFDQNVLYIHV